MILYVLQIALYVYGFLKLKVYSINKNNLILENKTYLTVIIPFKNEADNLNLLVRNLKNQSLEKNQFDVLFINDHSIDTSSLKLVFL